MANDIIFGLALGSFMLENATAIGELFGEALEVRMLLPIESVQRFARANLDMLYHSALLGQHSANDD